MIRPDYLPFGKPNFSDEEIAAVTRVMRSGWVGMGSETIAFERELAEYLGAPFVVTVNSCTSALSLSLVAHGVGPGDEVICPSLTWCATANAALYLGARAVFCDIDEETLSVTPETVLARVTDRTRAVIVVHYGGYALDVARLRAVLPANVAIIEDAAHALGSRYPTGGMVGSSGNLVCFSFYANKNLSTGEGGAIALFDERVAERLQSLRQNAMPVNAWKRFVDSKTVLRHSLTELGYKMNWTDLQACIGRVQLKRQPEFTATRAAIAGHYLQRLTGHRPALLFQRDLASPDHARHLFVIRVAGQRLTRDELLLELRARNVGASIHYPPLHGMPLYRPQALLPLTDRVADEIVTLPISASMTIEDADYVACQVLDLI